jgi:hypothetical protein
VTTIRVRCHDCGAVVFEAEPPVMWGLVCVNRLKPGDGPCERDRHAEGARWSEALRRGAKS